MKQCRLLTIAMVLFAGSVAVDAAELSFAFNKTSDAEYTQVAPGQPYDAARGFGFLIAAEAPDAPSIFAVDVPEGNYDVTIRFGDAKRATSTTVKAESRRLMLERVETKPGEVAERSFTVNVRRPAMIGGGLVSISDKEKGPPTVADWDEHLSLEFNGQQPGVASLKIKRVENATTVFLAGDSTVTDQPREPWNSWGEMLPRFFGRGVGIANQSWSGLTLTSFEHQKRLQKILDLLKKDDYVFIQFGHNDQKEKSAGAGPYTSYKSNLRRYIESIRQKGGRPVLLTPMERRRWQGDTPQPTLSDFANAVRQIGWEQRVPVIDLNAMSLKLYSALGPEGSKKAFVYYPANTFPGQKDALKDDTHHSAYGGYELARCVVEGIKAEVPELAAHLTDDVGVFDPAKPDLVENVKIPLSPATGGKIEKPAGS